MSRQHLRPRLLAYFGHHKCASSWLGDITRDLCLVAGLSYAHVHNPRMFQDDLGSFALRNHVEFLAYVNANHKYTRALDGFRAFHVIRDPRDIVISSYFSHLHSHPTDEWPELIEHRRELQAIDKDRGLFVVIDFLADVMDDIASWDYQDARILELKMEDVIRSPDEALDRAFRFLGLADSKERGLRSDLTALAASVRRRRPGVLPVRLVPLPQAVIRDTVKRNAYELKANGRGLGVENVMSHYRKGTPGDWANHFSTAHKTYFKERYGDLLVRLGYECDMEW